MNYLFKTLCTDHNGIAGFEVFKMEDGSYKCIQSSWKGYMYGPGNLVIKHETQQLAKRWQCIPPHHSCEKQLIDNIIEFENK